MYNNIHSNHNHNRHHQSPSLNDDDQNQQQQQNAHQMVKHNSIVVVGDDDDSDNSSINASTANTSSIFETPKSSPLVRTSKKVVAVTAAAKAEAHQTSSTNQQQATVANVEDDLLSIECSAQHHHNHHQPYYSINDSPQDNNFEDSTAAVAPDNDTTTMMMMHTDEDTVPIIFFRTNNNSHQQPAELFPPNQELAKEFLQRKLRFHFMSPLDKWRTKRRFPFKLLFQLLKIIFVTLQITYFGSEMAQFVNYEEATKTAFHEILLSGWDTTREVYAYPPSNGAYAVYTVDSFYDNIDYAIKKYSNLSQQSVGTFGYGGGGGSGSGGGSDDGENGSTNSSSSSSSLPQLPQSSGERNSNFEQQYPMIIIEQRHYFRRSVDPAHYHFAFDDRTLLSTLVIENLYPAGDARWQEQFGAREYFRQHNFTIDFDTLIELRVKFPLRTIFFNPDINYWTGGGGDSDFDDDNDNDNDDGVHISSQGRSPSIASVRCYELNITIRYNNVAHDGTIPITLTTERRVHQCKDEQQQPQQQQQLQSSGSITSTSHHGQIAISRQHYAWINWPLSLNWIVLIFCTFSIILCIRSLYRAQRLRVETEEFFLLYHERSLLWLEWREFIDLWIVIILFNDLLIILGTIMKIKLESSDIIESQIYTKCSLLLGVGNLLVWLGLLRYLSYFHSYNILIVTIEHSMPNVLRFLFCVLLVYCGFCFCGWIVLGPHHLKFRTLSSTSECLFSLMNGDDMFATFFSTDVGTSTAIWWFSRIYFYLFISVAIYVIVSLFIAIILDSYESIRDYYAHGPKEMKSPLQKFVEEYPIESLAGGNFSNGSIVDVIHQTIGTVTNFFLRFRNR